MSAPTRDELVALFHDFLALISMELLPDGGALPGMPGTWSPRPDGAPGARVRLAPDERVLVDGVVTGGVVDIGLDEPASPRTGRVGLDAAHRIVVYLFPDAGAGTTWVGLASESAPRLSAFQGIDAYPDDDRWRLPVVFTVPTEDERHSAIERFRGGGELSFMPRAGWFTVTVEGAEYRLSVDRALGYAYVNFRDAGSGTESHGAGRVVRLTADPAEVDVLDLNRSAVAPCAFNPLISCPLPSESNVIHTVVRAGQREVLFDNTV